MALDYKDYYEVLGVPRDADHEAIRRAYRKLARTYHPDLNSSSDAEDRFKELGEAYEVLSDPDKRERYDRLGADWRQQEQQTPETNFEEFFTTRGFGNEDARVEFSDDLFERLFGGRAGGGQGWRSSGPLRGLDREAVLELSLEDALEGGRRRLTLDDREIEVNFPAGVRDGQLIRLAGQGGSGRDGGPSGDLYLRDRAQAPPELPPARRRRSRCRPSGRTVAGGARCDRSGSDPRRQRPGPRACRLLQRAAPPAARSRAAEARGRQGRSARDRQGHRSHGAV